MQVRHRLAASVTVSPEEIDIHAIGPKDGDHMKPNVPSLSSKERATEKAAAPAMKNSFDQVKFHTLIWRVLIAVPNWCGTFILNRKNYATCFRTGE